MSTKSWIIQECEHCSTVVSGKSRFCPEYRTVDKRKEMDKDNEKLFKEKGLEYHCKFCEKQAERKLQKAERDKKFAEV